jgi:hypothetical protein
MEKLAPSSLDSGVVAEAVLDHLWSQQATNGSSPHLTGSPLLLQKLWSNIYFLSVMDAGELRELVAKIAHFPDQATPEISWQSEELLIRGRREFETMTRVFNHFMHQPDSLLTALHPQAYLPEINAVLMDFVSGRALYDECIALRHLLSAAGRRRAEQVMHRAGQWLRWFHRLPLDNAPRDRIFNSSDTFSALLNSVDQLRCFGVDPSTWPQWSYTLAALSQVSHSGQVWTHGDFHLRNVLVVFPHDAVLGLDTALERIDSPYYDLGKFAADLKTRRAMILRGGLLPPPGVVQALTRAFLSGYLAGAPVSVLSLALYEGRFIFEKWVESLTAIRETFHGSTAPVGAAIGNLVVNPTFGRIIKGWMGTINNAAASKRVGLYQPQNVVCDPNEAVRKARSTL